MASQPSRRIERSPSGAAQPPACGAGGIAEHALVVGVRSGSESAFEELFRAYAQMMGQAAYRYLRSVPDAEDVVMHVFHNLWMHRRTWTPRGALAIYLRIATRNQALNVLRGARNAARCQDRVVASGIDAGMGEMPVGAEERMAVADLAAGILDAADTLPKRRRTVFLLKWRDGLTNADIATRLGVSPKAVEVHLTRAMRVIRARVRSLL